LVRLVDRALDGALRLPKGTPPLLEEAMRYCVLPGGKRFRPLLVLGGCEAVGGSMARAMPVACSVELIHAYSLVHDDLPAMDNAAQRRGRPSCHRQFGEATAILVGDALLTRAFELLSIHDTPNALLILQTIGRASGTVGLIGGQALDLATTERGASPPRPEQSAGRGGEPAPAGAKGGAAPISEIRRSGPGGQGAGVRVPDLEEVARRKTAALMTASVVTGGLAGGASETALSRLRRFGERLGVAFQGTDDLHDGDGLVALCGADAVQRRTQQLIHEAKQELRTFGRHATLLDDLADWLATA